MVIGLRQQHASGVLLIAVVVVVANRMTSEEPPDPQTPTFTPAPIERLPAISLPSLFIVRKVFPVRVLAMTFGIILAGGLLAGTFAAVFHL